MMTTVNPMGISTPGTASGFRARVASIAPEFLERVRVQKIDDLGQHVKRVWARGGEPCRDVLRRARPGEELILASFTPFTQSGPYKEYGPIFVLAQDTGELVSRDGIRAGSAQNYLREQFVIRAYSDAEEIIDAALVSARDAQTAIDRLFALSDAAFLHLRFPTYGCFAGRLDRP